MNLSAFELFGHDIRVPVDIATKITYFMFNGENKTICKRAEILYQLFIAPTENNRVPSIKEVADFTESSRNTVSAVYNRFLDDGVESILDSNHLGRQSILNQYEDKIEELFSAKPPLSIEDATLCINQEFDLSLTPKAVGNWLKSHGYRKLEPKSVPSKADPDAQRVYVEAFLKTYDAYLKDDNVQVYFADGAHLTYGYLGQSCWTKERPKVKSSYGRRRVNVLGFLNAKTFEVTTIMNDSYLNSISLISGIVKLRYENPMKEIFIILDNAAYQANNFVREYAKSAGVHLIFLPPYSPNLNLIERLWKFMKKKIVANRYYESYDDFYTAIESFLSIVHINYAEELKTLLAFNFEILDGNEARVGITRNK